MLYVTTNEVKSLFVFKYTKNWIYIFRQVKSMASYFYAKSLKIILFN